MAYDESLTKRVIVKKLLYFGPNMILSFCLDIKDPLPGPHLVCFPFIFQVFLDVYNPLLDDSFNNLLYIFQLVADPIFV